MMSDRHVSEDCVWGCFINLSWAYYKMLLFGLIMAKHFSNMRAVYLIYIMILRSSKFCAGASRCLTKWWVVAHCFSLGLDSMKHLEPRWKQIHCVGLCFVLQWLAECLEGSVESCIRFGKASFSFLLDLFPLYPLHHCSGGGLPWFQNTILLFWKHTLFLASIIEF